MVMAAVMLGGMVPPLAAGLAAKLLAPHRFSQKERDLGWQAMLKGILFITEGVIPYLAAAPRMRLACILGSATAGGLSMFFRCGIAAPHGGVFLMPIAINPLYYVLSLVVGALVGALCFTALRPQTVESGVMPRVKRSKKAAAADAPAAAESSAAVAAGAVTAPASDFAPASEVAGPTAAGVTEGAAAGAEPPVKAAQA